MSFTFVDERLTWLPVRWKGRSEAGDLVTHELELQVVLVDRSEVTETLTKLDKPSDVAFESVQGLVRNWRGVVDTKRKPVPLSDDLLRRLVDWPAFLGGFISAYGRAWAGLPDEREGSSESPDAGPVARAVEAATEVA